MQSRSAQVPIGTAMVIVRELTVAEIRNVLDLEAAKSAAHALQSPTVDLSGYGVVKRALARGMLWLWSACGLPAQASAAVDAAPPVPWEELLVNRVLTIDGVSKLHLQAMCDITDAQLFNAYPSEIRALIEKAKELNSFFFYDLLPALTGQEMPAPQEIQSENAIPRATESSSKPAFQPLFDMATLMPGAIPGPSSSPPSIN
jgi:hypothetical protein